MRRLALLLLLSMGWTMPSDLEGQAEQDASPLKSGFVETVWIVRDLGTWIDIFIDAGGWEVAHRGDVDPRWSAFWNLPDGTQLEEVLLRNPGTDRGWVRLLRLDQDPAPMIRPHARSWDSGGHFDVNLRVIAIDELLQALEQHGFTAYSPPVEFTFGPFRVSEVLAQGPDGIVLAMIERLEPTLEGWPHLKQLSRVFNATQIVADFDRSLDFYTRVLGFKTYLEHEGASKEAGPNVLGLPHNLTQKIPRRVAILSPDGKNDGSIEILSFEGLTGADHSSRAKAPNRGIYALRFPVEDLNAWRIVLQARGASVGEVSNLVLAPWGSVRAFSLRAPEGAMLEFFEKIP